MPIGDNSSIVFSFLQPGLLAQPATEAARLGPFFTPLVVLEMLSQAGGSCEAFGADVTEERFAAGVNSLMVLKAALRAELFSTF